MVALSRLRPPRYLLATILWVALGLVAGGPYVAPGLLPADAGEFQLVTRELGVAHPPGYPLYTVTAHLFGRVSSAMLALPLMEKLIPADVCRAALMLRSSEDRRTTGPVSGADECRKSMAIGAAWPWLMSLFSLLLALLTLIITYGAGRLIGGARASGMLAAATLASMPVFVQQATTTNIRMATAVLCAACLALALRWLVATVDGELPPGFDPTVQLGARYVNRTLILLFVFLGLAATHHPSLVFLAPPALLVIVMRRPTQFLPGGIWLPLTCGVVAGALPMVYLVARDRAAAVLAPGNLNTAAGLWYHVSGAGFRGDLRPFDDPAALWDRTLVVGNLIFLQIGIVGVVTVTVGIVWLLVRRRSEAVLLLGTASIFIALAIVYRAPQTVEYLMPAHIALAILAAAAGGAFLDLNPHALIASPILRRGAVASLAIAIAVQAGATVSIVRLTHPRHDELAARVGACAADEAKILANWHHATPLWAAAYISTAACSQAMNGCGPTLAAPDVHYVAPAGAEPIGDTWARLAAEAAQDGRSLILTNRSPAVDQAGPPLWPMIDTPFWTSKPALCGPVPASMTISASTGVYHAPVIVFDDRRGPRFLSPETADAEQGTAGVAQGTTGPAPPADVAGAAPGSLQPLAAWLEMRTSADDPPDPPVVTVAFRSTAPPDPATTAVVQLMDPATGTVHGQFDRALEPSPYVGDDIADTNPLSQQDDGRLLAIRGELHAFRGDLPEPLLVTVGIYNAAAPDAPRWSLDTAASEQDDRGPGALPARAPGPAALPLAFVWPDGYDTDNGISADDGIAEEDGIDEDGADDGIGEDNGIAKDDAHAADDVTDVTVPSALPQRFLVSLQPGDIPFGDAMTLVAYGLHRAGDTLVVDLRWLAERAWRSDYTVSVQVIGPDGLFAQHDGTPASGAFPTLKWLPDQRIGDRHRLALPPDLPSDTHFTVSVGVYDAFSLEPLSVADADRARAGQGQRAVLHDGPIN